MEAANDPARWSLAEPGAPHRSQGPRAIRWSAGSRARSPARSPTDSSPPGADLNSVELATRFGTSRTPVREALMLLEKEGLVEIPPRRRPRVCAYQPRRGRGTLPDPRRAQRLMIVALRPQRERGAMRADVAAVRADEARRPSWAAEEHFDEPAAPPQSTGSTIAATAACASCSAPGRCG